MALSTQANDTHDLLGDDSQADADHQSEPGPPPYESVMMSGYDGVCLPIDDNAEMQIEHSYQGCAPAMHTV